MDVRCLSRRAALLVSLLGLALLAGGVLGETEALAAAGVLAGKVTSAATHTAISGLEVRAWTSETSWVPFTTNAGGEFGGGVEAQNYRVEFIPKSGSPFADEYYNDKLTYAGATVVTVNAGKETTVDAELPEASSVAGTVKSAASGGELGDIDVTAYNAEGANEAVQTVTTNPFGNYTLTRLPHHNYVIGFAPALESGLNLAPQFFAERPRFSEASVVHLAEGENRTGVDGKLLKGGSIEGTITDAATHAPLAGVDAVVVQAGHSIPVGVGVSSASGAYLAGALATGSYAVLFLPGSEAQANTYTFQLYNGVPVPEEISNFGALAVLGTPVSVIAGVGTGGIDAAIVRREPADTIAPAITGTPAAGQTLQCSDGTWTGIPTIVFAQRWLRDGTAIAGATGSAYGVQSSDQGHGIACEVTATNELASVSAVSRTVTVLVPSSGGPPVPPPSPAAAPALSLLSSSASASRGTLHVRARCAGAACRGSVELTENVSVKRRVHGHEVSRRTVVVLAKGSYSLAAGATGTVALRLTSAGSAVLRSAGRHVVHTDTIASVSGGRTATRALALSLAHTSKHR